MKVKSGNFLYFLRHFRKSKIGLIILLYPLTFWDLRLHYHRMGKFAKAEEVFKDLPENTKDQVFKLAAGKVIYFPKNQDKLSMDHEQICIKYANAKRTYEEIADEYGLSKMRICQIIKEERARYSEERVKFWKNQGMSLRGIAKLFKKSHEAIRRTPD